MEKHPENMLTVIADDITGAAEIGGIAFSYGMDTRLITDIDDGIPQCDVLVVATDTRSMDEENACKESLRIGKAVGLPLFKKTDSALRGHVATELEALIQATGYTHALYLPANPSKGRVIRNGIYYINSIPINETEFAFDPEFPATSASVKERIGDSGPILFTDATSMDDIKKAINDMATGTMPAGAADLFETYLQKLYPECHRKPYSSELPNIAKDAIILQGSTQSKPLPGNIPVSMMPEEIYQGYADISAWTADALAKYDGEGSVILSLSDRKGISGHDVAVRLREAMAQTTAVLTRHHLPKELVIEGGATAFATLNKLGWSPLTITNELAPGVIRMESAQGTHVTMKPGSYAWR